MLGRTLGNYVIQRELGRGGMGVVYAARHQLLGRTAAIKVLLPRYSHDEDIVLRFFNEARAATAIRHPGIVEVHDFGFADDGSAYLVMELCEGASLGAFARARPLPLARALGLARHIASALAAAHAAGIVHRDLKPDNVFVVPDPDVDGGHRIKLLDFGIAKLADTERAPHTSTGVIMGTPDYMSPEQCRGAGGVDRPSDLYALGCIVFELVCGCVPFRGAGPGDVISAHLTQAPPAPSRLVADLPVALERLILGLLAKQPADRPTDVADQLARIVAELPPDLVLAPTPLGIGGAATVPSDRGRPTVASIAPPAGETVVSVAPEPRTPRVPRPTQPPVVRPRRRRWAPVAIGAGAVAVVAIGAMAIIDAPRERISHPPAVVSADAGHPSDAGTARDRRFVVAIADLDRPGAVTSPSQAMVRAWIALQLPRLDPAFAADLDRRDGALRLEVALGHVAVGSANVECTVDYRLSRPATGQVVLEIANRGFAYKAVGDALPITESCARSAADAAMPFLLLAARDVLGLSLLDARLQAVLDETDRELRTVHALQKDAREAARLLATRPDTSQVRAERARVQATLADLSDREYLAHKRQGVLGARIPELANDVSRLVLSRACRQALEVAIETYREYGSFAAPLIERAATCVDLPGATRADTAKLGILGQAYTRLERGDNTGARTRFLELLSLDPDDVDAHVGLAAVGVREGRVDPTLIRHADRAVELAGGTIQTLMLRALVHEALRNTNAAIADYELLLSRYDHADARVELARLRAASRP